MASSSSQRMIHQDYIARIRYSNALPPPPNPPKLLDIPNTGLASGQYTAPGFASRLARDQPLNIEADAELGMPLDLVGMPGIFDGDESSIQAPIQQPPVHPHDRALLRPLSTLGKPKLSDSGVSFLRRTEYISSYSTKSRFDSTASKSLADGIGRRKKAVTNVDKESPEEIKKDIERSFEFAAQQIKNPSTVKHPSDKGLTCVAAYPILPDHTSITDAGGYCSVKFLTNPVVPGPTYDARLEASILAPIMQSQEEADEFDMQVKLHERDPKRYPAPDLKMDYNFFMLNNASDAIKLKRKFEALDEEASGEDLYTSKTGDDKGCFQLKRIRAYESASVTGAPERMFDDEVAIVISDGTDGLRSKAAYYYPIAQRIAIRPQRSKNINIKLNQFTGTQEPDNEEQIDALDVIIEEPSEDVVRERNVFKAYPCGKPDDGDDEDAVEESRKTTEESRTPEGNE